MGAGVHGKGNVTVSAEFNVWYDPEASHMVFDRFPLLEIVPWETCISSEYQFTKEFLHQYTSGTSSAGVFIREITKLVDGYSTIYFCDPITLSIAIDPSIITLYSDRRGFVELSGKHTRGMTVVNWGCSDMKEINASVPNLKIIEKIDLEKVMELFLRSVN